MPSKETPAKDPNIVVRKTRRMWKRGKGWITMPSRARKPLTETQIRRAFYEKAFNIEDLLSIARRLEREGERRKSEDLQKEVVHMSRELLMDMNAHAITRALRANRILDSRTKEKVRWAMYRLNEDHSTSNAQAQNEKLSMVLGKKFKPFAEDYNRVMATIPIQVRGLITRRQEPRRTVFVARPSPFGIVRKLFRRGRGKRSG